MRLIESLSATQALGFAGITLLLLGVLGWRLYLGLFRREPPGLFRRSFFDATGQPNGVLLTVFNAVLMINALTICGMWMERWPPVYVWATWGAIVLSGVVADTAVTRAQITASAPPPADATGPPMPGSDFSPVSSSSSLSSSSPSNEPVFREPAGVAESPAAESAP